MTTAIGALNCRPRCRVLYQLIVDAPGVAPVRDVISVAEESTVSAGARAPVRPGEAPEAPVTRTVIIVVDTPAEHDSVVAHLGERHATPGGATRWKVADAAGWDVAVVVAGLNDREARKQCDAAIEELDPAVLLFIGSALPVGETVAGDVIAVERVSRAYPPRAGARRRPQTRTASDLELVRAAALACDEGAWHADVRQAPQEVRDGRLGHLVTGHLPSRGVAHRYRLEQLFPDAVAKVPDHWAHVPGLYADDNLPALAFCAIRDELDLGDAARAVAADHAVALALAVLTTHDPDLDAIEAVLEDGLDLHRPFDTPALTVQRSRGFLQGRFIKDVVPAGRAEKRPPGEAKARIGTRRVGALLQTVSSPRRAVPPRRRRDCHRDARPGLATSS